VFPKAYLDDPRNPRWVAKPTVAYLWARTVRCKGCRATIPLLKTRWLAKKDNKRVLLTMSPNDGHTGVVFGVETDVSVVGGNAAQRREHDKRHGAGTMTRSGAQCPCCGLPTMTMEDIRLEGRAGRLRAVMTVVVVDGSDGREYRLATEEELRAAEVSKSELDALFAEIPFGLPTEPTPRQGPGAARAFSVENYGLDQWAKLFTGRQLLTIGTFVTVFRRIPEVLEAHHYSEAWADALVGSIGCAVDRLADSSSSIAHWQKDGEFNVNTFQRFALPISWDFSEISPISDTTGNFLGAIDWVGRASDHFLDAATAHTPTIVRDSAIAFRAGGFDTIVTDPPYYDAIPYSDLMDFFYVWLRRMLGKRNNDFSSIFGDQLGPKWDHDAIDGELIDDASRFAGDKVQSRRNYEDGMARAFRTCHGALQPEGRLVVVFANKQPEAWETLVGALIRAGFVVDGSWPIHTERQVRTRSLGSAALASSVWLVCKKRPPARPGWDTAVLTDMHARIHTQLRAFWDAGIRGPDFVWAATGPALEAYSKYPVVKKADAPDGQMTVSEFLREVRRLVVDFVVGRVLSQSGENSEGAASLDDVTTYYLLHRNDFGLDDAPIGACILYALSCNLSDRELADRFDILVRSGRELIEEDQDEDADVDDDAEEDDSDNGGKGNKVRLKSWNQRRGRMLGLEAPAGRPVPLIDQAHRLMHLWRAGDQVKVDEYLDVRGLKRNALFAQLLQALIELAPVASDERSILESISNHITARGGVTAPRQMGLAL
jgi:putative DNA methylase